MKIGIRLEATSSGTERFALIPEVGEALRDWISRSGKGVLIGGLALSMYVRPRATIDVDVLFLNRSDVPEQVALFKHHRNGAFQHNKHHVKIETVTPESVHIPRAMVERVIETAHAVEGFRVASAEGLVALKLYGARGRGRRLQDLADVQRLLEKNPTLSLEGWPVDTKALSDLEAVRAEVN